MTIDNKNLESNNIKIDENSLTFFIGYVTPNSVKPFYLIINNANGYIVESSGK